MKKYQLIKKGNCVRTKVGVGRVKEIDTHSYSIPLVIINLTRGKNKGEKVAMVESQLVKVKKC